MIKRSNYTLCSSSAEHNFTAIQDLQSAYLESENNINSTLYNKWIPIIKNISRIGHLTSFTLLVIAMIVFYLLRKFRNPSNRLHMHLFASFIMRAVIALLKDCLFINDLGFSWDVVAMDSKIISINDRSSWTCKIITSLWQYFLVANYTWIFMEGLYLQNLVYLPLPVDTKIMTIYAILGWVLPIPIVTVWIILRVMVENTQCWASQNDSSLSLIINIPITVSIVFNFIIFINIIRVVRRKMKTSAHLQQRKTMQYGRWDIRSTLVLIPLFGVHYTLFFGLSYWNDPLVQLIWFFCDQVFASFQGCFVAFLYCIFNTKVQNEVRTAWQTKKLRRGNIFATPHRNVAK